MDDDKFWKIRSEKYNNLDWATDQSYIDVFLSATDFNSSDIVLDVGTGTGIIAHALSPVVKEVIGMDRSQDMLEHSNWKENKYFIRRDIRDAFFHDGVFDKVTARMVFHHIIKDTQRAMDECYRIIKPGGKMVLAEGIPPTPELKDDYTEIFRLKEERITFLQEDLVKLLDKSGFKNIEITGHKMTNFSVRNWLSNSGQSKKIQDKIYDLHVTSSDLFKEAYKLELKDDDCFIEVKNLILVGEK